MYWSHRAKVGDVGSGVKVQTLGYFYCVPFELHATPSHGIWCTAIRQIVPEIFQNGPCLRNLLKIGMQK